MGPAFHGDRRTSVEETHSDRGSHPPGTAGQGLREPDGDRPQPLRWELGFCSALMRTRMNLGVTEKVKIVGALFNYL